MNINSIMSEGQGLVLSNVEVRRLYPVKEGAHPHRAALIGDSSGTAIIKFWGAGAGRDLREGEIITVQAIGEGGIVSKEYPQGSGKFTLNANSCEIIRQSAPAASQAPSGSSYPATATTSPAASQTPSQGYGAPAPSHCLSGPELAQAQAAHFRALYAELDTGIVRDGEDLATACALMVGDCGQWWHGQKWPGKGD